MNRFIDDMIHMTEGEKLIEYWWLWLISLLIFYVVYNVSREDD